MNTIQILGSGTSTGIPLIACHCAVCKSPDPKNKRLRCSILLKLKGVNILVDTTPDLRTQALRHKIEEIDAVIITHDHADHLHGIDDLRAFTFKKKEPLPLYTNLQTEEKIAHRFSYIFDKNNPYLGTTPKISLNQVSLNSPFEIKGIPFTFFLLPHGPFWTLGFYVEKFAYLIDCHDIPSSIIQFLKEKKLELLIIDCVKKGTHKTHLGTKSAFSFIHQIRPKKVGLTHLSHDLDHSFLEKLAKKEFSFPVSPLFDGQTLNLCS